MKRWPFYWTVVITIIGILIETFVAGPHEGKIGTILIFWFFILGVVPGTIVFAVVNRDELIGSSSKPSKYGPLARKLLLGFVALVVIAFIGINWFVYTYNGLFVWDVLATGPLLPGEVQAKAGTFERTYPEMIKGNWEPNAWHMERMMVLDLDRVRELGLNTVSISVEYEFADDGTYFMRDEDKIMSNLVRAKDSGFTVWMGVSFVGAGYGHALIDKGITMERYLEVSDEVALRWAEVAEQYGVELFCPQAELDHMLRTYYFEGYNVREDEVAQTVADWHSAVLPKVKELYTGRTVAKFAAISREWANATFDGYDYVGMGMMHNTMNTDEFRQYARERYSILSQIAENSGAEWGVFEAWFPFGGPWFPQTTTHDGQQLEPLQDDYYTISFEEYENFEGATKPSVFIFHSWTMLSSPVKGRPAEQVLKDFFGKI